jgi:predicted dehydrogenase/nucleoside-diphosphate-sugar epimerase
VAGRVLPLRVGLIGSGKMGQHHLKAITASGMATVVGVADPAASAEDLSSVLPAGAIIVPTAEALLRDAKPDVVHIVTPPASHTELALQAIEAGCHVYVEKPFTATVDEAQRILTFAESRSVKVCPGHQVLFEAPALMVKENLSDIGRLVHIESVFSFKMVRRTITHAEQLKDILPHAVYPVVDQIRHGTGNFSDPIESVGMSINASGDAYVLLRLADVTAVVMVTLSGRPVEQYQTLVGTNGSLRADYIGGFLGRLIGPGTGPGVLLTPYRRAASAVIGTTRGIARLLLGGSYPGLRTLVRRFYESVRDDAAPPLSPQSIVDTVRICETVGRTLDQAVREQESAAQARLSAAERGLPPVVAGARKVLLTGGTGLLGKTVAEELRQSGLPVRVVARRVPPYSRRVAGVEYAAADLGRSVSDDLLDGVGVIVHAAAETAGGKEEHRRNSIEATRNIVEACARAGVRQLIHVSSLGVLKTSREMGKPLDENTPVETSLGRGPYVWGKAESEVLAAALGAERGISVRIIRPGPLVDFRAYHPPGRLGREIGPWFLAFGPQSSALSICDVGTAARVIRSYIENFDAAPPMLNLVESPAPTRRELMERYLRDRSDLSVWWFPGWLLRALSGPLKLAQRVALKSKQPIDVAAAFASEGYDTTLAGKVIASSNRVRRTEPELAATSTN